MTDEKLDQILKQALTPKNTASELEIKKIVRTYNMKKFIKGGIAVAACAAICLGGFSAIENILPNKQDEVSNTVFYDAVTNLSDSFTIKVQAAELTGDNLLPITVTNDYAGAVLGGDEGNTVYYCFNLPLSCEGENIKTITYSINKGCFQVIQPADEQSQYVIDYKEQNGKDTNFGECCGKFYFDPETGQKRAKKVMYLDSFTVDYNKQTGDGFFTNIGNVVPNMEKAYNLLWNSDHSVDNSANAYNILLSDVKITVTATFEDGTQCSKVLGLESKVIDKESNKGTYKRAEIFFKNL